MNDQKLIRPRSFPVRGLLSFIDFLHPFEFFIEQAVSTDRGENS